MKTHLLIPVVAVLAILPYAAQSTDTPPGAHGPGSRHHRIDDREANLDKRIDQGVAKGKLTTEQAASLEGKLELLKQDEAKALQNDGKIGRKEADQLRKEANQLSREVYRVKHPGKGK
jgi:hypothetical protein